MELATGAMGPLLPKMLELLKDEYKLQANLKKDVKFLESEMRSMDAALRKVAKVPRDQLDEQVKIWADEVRELSYQMEDLVDGFLVRVEGSEPAADPDTFMGLMKMMTNLFKEGKDLLFNKGKDLFNKGRDRHQIAHAIKDIKDQVQEVAARRKRYKVDDVRANSAAATTVDPRMLALFKDQRELVGIEEPRDELIKRLTDEDDGVSNSEQQLKILSIFGFGGLGKTTLAKAVYDRIQAKFVRKAFVSVGQKPDVKKVFMDILLQLDESSHSSAAMLDQWQLIGKVRGLLEDKRYLIVIDDIWDIESWEVIKCAWVDSSCGSLIMTTTRVFKVAKETGHVYRHEPLSRDNSEELFYKRLSIGRGKSSYDQFEMSEKILQKCGGVPLAIITIASLLVNKPREDWSEVYDSIGFGHGDNKQVDNTRKILLYSYYDLPCYLKNCLLHLSIYPEDYEIQKKILIWKWIAEGFVHKKSNMGLFELGERYFNELINRSMIQPVEFPHEGIVYACRVHDLVLDMIYSLAKEEKFVAVLGIHEQHTSSQSNARRLAIQKRAVDDQQDPILANTHMQQVRSFNAIQCHLDIVPSLSSFQVLRVLALEGCTYAQDPCYHLEYLGRLLQLRYLGLSGRFVPKLPEEIGKLKFLETLDLRDALISELPQSVGLLRQLKFLGLPTYFKGVLDWIGNMSSLEELWVGIVSRGFVKELGKLIELREFNATIDDATDDAMSFKDLMESLGHLHKLQGLVVYSDEWQDVDWADCGGYVPSRHLHRLTLYWKFPMLPAWIDPSLLPHLSHLDLRVKVVEARDVDILGKFPQLISLTLWTVDNNVFPDVVGGGAFPKLRCFHTDGKLRFMQGAMPSLESVQYRVWWEAAEADSLRRDFASIGNLPCLQFLEVDMTSSSAADKEVADAAFRHAVNVHPNNPTLQLVSDVLLAETH